MKTFWKALIIALMSLGLGNWNARAVLEVSAGVQINAVADFQAPLAAQGAWVTVGSYGRCWHPVGVAVGWRPYCDGEWVWTDCGWYWESDEPWAWACYHYGCWVDDASFGWVWVPDIEWAPAWVTWRIGGGYCGWAPRPPRGVFGFGVGASDPAFVFVATDRFNERITPSTVIVNNRTIINQTTVINNIRHESRSIDGGAPQRVVVNTGPELATIQRATANRVRTVSLHEALNRTPAPSTLMHESRSPAREEKRSLISQPSAPARSPEPASRELRHDVEPAQPAHTREPEFKEPPRAPAAPRIPAGPVGERGKGEGRGRGHDGF